MLIFCAKNFQISNNNKKKEREILQWQAGFNIAESSSQTAAEDEGGPALWGLCCSTWLSFIVGLPELTPGAQTWSMDTHWSEVLGGAEGGDTEVGTAADRWRARAPPPLASVRLHFFRTALRFPVFSQWSQTSTMRLIGKHTGAPRLAQSRSRAVAGHLSHFRVVSLDFLWNRQNLPRPKRQRLSRLAENWPHIPLTPEQLDCAGARRVLPSCYQPSLAGWSLIEVCAPAAIELGAH